jgi:adenylate kinase family enzyme
LGRSLAGRLGAPFLELDSVFHQPEWTPLPSSEFQAQVGKFMTLRGAGLVGGRGGGRGVIDGNYSTVQSLVWARADTVVWLDLPRRTVMRRIVVRTLRRIVRRVELWNGNRERWRNFFTWDPEESVISWAWHRHDVYRSRYSEAMTDPALSHLTFVRLRSPRQVRKFLAAARLG